MAKVPLALRIDQELKDAAKQIATLENRNLTNLVETMIRDRALLHAGIQLPESATEVMHAKPHG